MSRRSRPAKYLKSNYNVGIEVYQPEALRQRFEQYYPDEIKEDQQDDEFAGVQRHVEESPSRMANRSWRGFLSWNWRLNLGPCPYPDWLTGGNQFPLTVAPLCFQSNAVQEVLEPRI